MRMPGSDRNRLALVAEEGIFVVPNLAQDTDSDLEEEGEEEQQSEESEEEQLWVQLELRNLSVDRGSLLVLHSLAHRDCITLCCPLCKSRKGPRPLKELSVDSFRRMSIEALYY
ncbi:unnamed protein product [Polarella glacialis]|uniref:Uncharacterized protein n=1 Tax=Polarella glacialis TaxID=89957 RepID=A0A813KZN3_POLGL|nr:unnamed protein product [Polarella glacialis]